MRKRTCGAGCYNAVRTDGICRCVCRGVNHAKGFRLVEGAPTDREYARITGQEDLFRRSYSGSIRRLRESLYNIKAAMIAALPAWMRRMT